MLFRKSYLFIVFIFNLSIVSFHFLKISIFQGRLFNVSSA
ncbi:hypothetical protein LEP1GSC186_4832 [Leptospira noguchii serovar Autumnalis str. ZUN142]|uniref:Uncharacterized protein n=1 Tax=Leptospira noguchii serovar Autumnalis str. ZUN142 TaxID=1085540 RepID=M6UGF4_9LEPT|nr:hypothetical protein LEP1GSC186_4832 [Leptospira noguchii serovar Autumnalis str. ZUN142]